MTIFLPKRRSFFECNQGNYTVQNISPYFPIAMALQVVALRNSPKSCFVEADVVK